MTVSTPAGASCPGGINTVHQHSETWGASNHRTYYVPDLSANRLITFSAPNPYTYKKNRTPFDVTYWGTAYSSNYAYTTWWTCG